MVKVLVVATSRKTRGGITSVVKAHERGEQWEEYHCRWIETHIDRGTIQKLFILCKGMIQFLWYLPGADLVHIHLSEPTSAKRKVPFFKLAKTLNKKTIIHFHSFSPETTIKGKDANVYKYLFTCADAVIVLSNYWKNAVNDVFGLGNKVKVIYNPCPDVNNRYTYQKENYILYAGTINQRKGYSDLIRGFALIAEKYPSWKLVFAGNGEIKEAQELADKFNIEKQCVFLGWVNGDEKDKVFKQASVFCLPSYAEGFPMAVLDAWAYGLPVITTPVGGIPDIAIDGQNLLLFEPGNVEGLSKCLERVVSNLSQRNVLSEESKHLAATTFNISVINKQVGDMYRLLLGGGMNTM